VYLLTSERQQAVTLPLPFFGNVVEGRVATAGLVEDQVLVVIFGVYPIGHEKEPWRFLPCSSECLDLSKGSLFLR